jgi:ABC-type amino acid transport substrate-binding protein
MKNAILAVMFLVVLSIFPVCNVMAGPAMDRIIEKGELVVGTTGDQPPMTAISKKGEIMGMDADIAHAIAAALDLTVTFKVPIHKWLICPISALCSKFYPRNITCMPAVKFFASLDLDQIIRFLDGHEPTQ